MKKFLPIILLLVGVLVFAGVYFFVIKGNSSKGDVEEEEIVTEIPEDQKPLAALIPSMDGHWLKLQVTDIKVAGAASLDYELLYKVADGRTQGVPGNVDLGSKSSVERVLLLGSESSGKYRYDEGVDAGTLTLRFRNEKGKLIGKLSTEFKISKSGKNFTVTMDSFSAGEKVYTSSSDFTDGKSAAKPSTISD